MHLNYDTFCSIPTYVVSVQRLPESLARFRQTKNQLHSIGITHIHRANAVFVQDHKLIKNLVNRYGLQGFQGRDTHLACTLSFIRLYERLLNTKEEYFNQLPDKWDVLHIGASVTQQAVEFNQTKKFISSSDWCTKTIKPINPSQTWNSPKSQTLPEPPWGGVMGGWCNILTRNALETYIKNSKHIFTCAGDLAFNTAYRDFGLNFLCINRPAEHINNCNLDHRKTGKKRRLIGLAYQANFKSLNDKYTKSQFNWHEYNQNTFEILNNKYKINIF